MIACLKLGCPYVMLDPDSPAERVGKILSYFRHCFKWTRRFRARGTSRAIGVKSLLILHELDPGSDFQRL